MQLTNAEWLERVPVRRNKKGLPAQRVTLPTRFANADPFH